MRRKMKAYGCPELCIWCNTAHYAIKELEEQIGLPFINLLAEVSAECNRRDAKRIGMICSDGLRKIGLYDKYFTAANTEMKLVHPSEDMQKLVTLGICNAKNIKRNSLNNEKYPEKLFSKVCDSLEEQSVDCIVGGCIDINVVFCPKDGGK